MNIISRFKRLNVWNKASFIGAISSIVAIPLAIILWHSNRSPTDQGAPSRKVESTTNENTPEIVAGDHSKTENREQTNSHSTVETNEMSSSGDKSPVVKAGRDAIINLGEKKADYVTDHDGAGALLMKEPNFRAFVSSTISGQGDKVFGRLVNGTEVEKIELKPADANEPSPPWAKVKVLEGEFKDAVGWILMNSLRKP